MLLSHFRTFYKQPIRLNMRRSPKNLGPNKAVNFVAGGDDSATGRGILPCALRQDSGSPSDSIMGDTSEAQTLQLQIEDVSTITDESFRDTGTMSTEVMDIELPSPSGAKTGTVQGDIGKKSAPARSEVCTRFLFGFYPDAADRMADQALVAIRKLLQEFRSVDPSACLVPWSAADKESQSITVNNFPQKRSNILPYCDSFRVGHPAEGKRWYVSLCVQHGEDNTSSSLLVDLEEVVKSEDWFLILCPIQSDKRTVDVGWFVYSLKEYTSPEFRDALAAAIGVSTKVFAVQWQKPKECSNDVYAMTVKAVEGFNQIISTALSSIYSSRSDNWPWGIRMRFIPYSVTLKTKNLAVDNLKSAQAKFTKMFVAVPLENIRVPLDSLVVVRVQQGEVKLSVREALMRISGSASQTTRKKSSTPNGLGNGVFHGVVEYQDQRGRRLYLVPYPEAQVNTSVGWMMATYPVTIMSHFYSRESILPLFVSHQIDSEAGTTYEADTDSIKNPTTMDLEECMGKDAQLFSFDLTMLNLDRNQQEKKRRHDGQLVRRFDDSSIGTVRGDPQSSAAGPNNAGTRPQS